MNDLEDIIKFMYFGEALKTVERSGWSIAGILSTRNESVAEHSYSTIITSILLSQYLRKANYNIDSEKIIIMAAIHDIHESITGDIPRTPENEKNREFKKIKEETEKQAAKEIFHIFEDSLMRFSHLWYEYSEGFTLEARVVRGADILDMILHARNLELLGYSPQQLDQFFQSSKASVESLNIELVTQIFDIFLKEHQEMMAKH